MKSLHKALDLMEYILNAEGRPVTPSEAAEQCGCHPATTVRILATLTERAYLRKVSRHRGYVPGPVVYALADRRCFYGCAAYASDGPIRELAVKLDIQVTFAVLEGSKRYVLHHYSADEQHPVLRRTAHETDFLETGTGRIMAAWSSGGALEEIMAKSEFPDTPLPGTDAWRKLEEEFAAIRRTGWTEFELRGKIPQRVFGAAVIVPDAPVCAVGTVVNANRDTEAFRESFRETVGKIVENITWQKRSF